MHNSKGPGPDLLEDVVVIVDRVLGLDVHRLRDVLGVDVEHELVVVLDLALLTPDLLPGSRVNLVLGLGLLLLHDALGLDGGALVRGVAASVDVLGEHPEPVLVAWGQIGHGEQVEPGVSGPGPGRHGQLLLLDDVVGD